MTYLEYLGLIATAIGTAASIMGVVLAWSSRYTNRLIREVHDATEHTLAGMRESTQQQHADALAILERMDVRAEERHREVITRLPER